MSKAKDLEQAGLVLDDKEYAKYVEWRELPFVGRFPHLAGFIMWVELLIIISLVAWIICP